MKALSTLKSAIGQYSFIGTFVLIAALPPVIFPEVALAASLQTSENQALVFEIKDPQNTLQNKKSLTLEQISYTDPLVVKVKQYLEDRKSPLAVYAADIVTQPQWQRALGVSFVESNLGKFCFDNNCSGIGVKPGHPSWRKYATKLDWFIDLNRLLEKPIYKERNNTFEKMRGVYVVPGSAGWVNGATKVYNELMAITKQAEAERREIADHYHKQIVFGGNSVELALIK